MAFFFSSHKKAGGECGLYKGAIYHPENTVVKFVIYQIFLIPTFARLKTVHLLLGLSNVTLLCTLVSPFYKLAIHCVTPELL